MASLFFCFLYLNKFGHLIDNNNNMVLLGAYDDDEDNDDSFDDNSNLVVEEMMNNAGQKQQNNSNNNNPFSYTGHNNNNNNNNNAQQQQQPSGTFSLQKLRKKILAIINSYQLVMIEQLPQLLAKTDTSEIGDGWTTQDIQECVDDLQRIGSVFVEEGTIFV